MEYAMEHSTLEARLATFEPPSKRSKLGWPHETPTADELARAGFYYKPSSSSNDNCICYLCGRSLDGWEPDDDPVQEHLKHASDCGWAILMDAAAGPSGGGDTMEDPTGQHFADARRATFAVGWPHEGKRGWTCKVEKMVEAGWHYVPTQDSDDFVSCVHCKLSLDGWEPKDNPFDEHYRRSPNCPFFQFAGTTAPSKRPKAKKGARSSKASRTSKASARLSNQSVDNTTMLSAAGTSILDIPDLDESIDTSTVSVMSTMSTASTVTTKGKRKGAGTKAKPARPKRAKTTRSTKAKKVEPEPELVEEPEIELDQTPMAIQDVGPELPVRSPRRPIPDPTASPKAEVAYPAVPKSPGALEEQQQQQLSPVRAPPQPSPTPVKSGRAPPATSATRSAAATSKQTALEEAQNPRSPAPPVSPSPPPSEIENAPPSSRPSSVRPPPPTQTIPLVFSPGEPVATWTPADVELIFQPATPQPADLLALTGGKLSAKEESMTVQEWIEHVAGQAEASLRGEAERVVGVFEREGQRAMGVLEGIVCV
jgi:hypothetical protein